MTSVQKELGQAISMALVAEIVARAFGTVFCSKVVSLATLDELLKPQELDVPLRMPSEFRHMHKEDETFLA